MSSPGWGAATWSGAVDDAARPVMGHNFVGGGQESEDRWRELFPLPPSSVPPYPTGGSTSQRRRHYRLKARVQEANAISECLNEMFGSKQSFSNFCTTSQKESQHRIFQQFCRVPKPTQYCSEREAVKELLQTQSDYDGGSAMTTVRPYVRDLVSLPEMGAHLVPLSQVMDPIGREVVGDALNRMLVDEETWGQIAEKHAGFRPYMDAVLQNNPKQYELFVKDLLDKNMIDFTSKPKDLIAPFFVQKKNGKLRLVLDCRGTNQRFKPPPAMALSAGATWSSVRIPKGQELHVAQSDIRDYFYSLELPAVLRDLFCLPAIRGDCLKEWKLTGEVGSMVNSEGLTFPRLRAVPMGWSWAMWISQRVHQFIALQSSGLGTDDLLVEGRPCPDLSSGRCALIVYADNLNVLGTNARAVQATKDSIVKELRETGFRVHEETEACTMSQSLGFQIDGAAGIISPIPERLDKIVKSFGWLAKRPKVSGKAIERLLGHAIHICLLRRELLSIFRSLYDFAYTHYNKKKRLWTSAAREAKWCSHLLFLCTVDMHKDWSSDVTASDASLSGIAVCRRPLDREWQAEIGSLKEIWRYKSCVPAAPREAALGATKLDPFSEPATAKPILTPPVEDPFELDVNFKEVDPSFLCEDDWHECFAVHMQHPEHITLLEGRGVIASLRHKFRSVGEFGRAHLHFCDNMSMTLTLSKGRSAQYSMLRICRRVACLLLATDSFLAVRWIPSERNIADGPSRRWERDRKLNAASREHLRKRQEEVDERCYPKASDIAGRAKGLRAFDSLARRGEQTLKMSTEEESERGLSSDHRGETADSGSEAVHSGRSPSFQGSDASGEGCGFQAGSHRLHTKGDGAQSVCKEKELQTESKRQLRLGLLQICEQHVRARLRPARRNQDIGSHHRCISSLFPQTVHAEDPESIAGMGKTGTTEDTASNSMATHSKHVHGAAASIRTGRGRGHPPDVHGLLEAGRSAGSPKIRSSAAPSRKSTLLPTATPGREDAAVQSGTFRRIVDAGLANVSMAGTRARGYSYSSGLSSRCHLRPPGDQVEMGTKQAGLGAQPLCPLPAEALGPVSRQASAPAHTPGSETKGKMGCRSKCQEIRSSWPNSSGVSSSATKNSAKVPAADTEVRPGGPKIFQPADKQSKNASYFVLELFSGCARPSQACAQHNFHSFAYDIEYGDGCNLLDKQIVDSLFSFIRKHAKKIALVWMGTPCTSWSRARKHDGGPVPLRDDDAGLMGLCQLKSADQAKVQLGNQFLEVTNSIISLCEELNVFWVVENPFTSRIWLTEPMRQWRKQGAKFIRSDFCAYGMPWRKSTGFLFHSGFNTLHSIAKVCNSCLGRCQFTNSRHITLVGQDKRGVWLTRRAQPYPRQLCAAIAAALDSAIP